MIYFYIIFLLKMTTLDDIFIDNNNFHNIPISVNFQGNNKIAKYKLLDYDSDFCIYESYNRKIRKNIYDNLKIKHYIKFGEECPICYDKIIHRNNAFLTDCGHSFHYSCIMTYDYNNAFMDNGISCPCCRSDMGLYENLKDKFKNSLNNFDILEDFERNIKIKTPKICYNFHLYKFNDHFHLINYKNCYYCNI